jgi:hypothetical protein
VIALRDFCVGCFAAGFGLTVIAGVGLAAVVR